ACIDVVENDGRIGRLCTERAELDLHEVGEFRDEERVRNRGRALLQDSIARLAAILASDDVIVRQNERSFLSLLHETADRANDDEPLLNLLLADIVVDVLNLKSAHERSVALLLADER